MEKAKVKKMKINLGLGKGWHKESRRHSNAKLYGKAGSPYKNSQIITAKYFRAVPIKYATIKKEGILKPHMTTVEKEKGGELKIEWISGDYGDEPLFFPQDIEVSAFAKKIGGAVIGATTGEWGFKTGDYVIYETKEKPDSDLSWYDAGDFGAIGEVRYYRPVKVKVVGRFKVGDKLKKKIEWAYETKFGGNPNPTRIKKIAGEISKKVKTAKFHEPRTKSALYAKYKTKPKYLRRGKFYTKNRRQKAFLEMFIRKDKPKCYFCGESISPTAFYKDNDNLTMHHKNGKHSDNRLVNVAMAHRTCHKSEHMSEFRHNGVISAKVKDIVNIGWRPTSQYALEVMEKFTEGSRDVQISGKGKEVLRAINIAELVRRKFLKSSKIASIDIGVVGEEPKIDIVISNRK